MDEGMKDTKFSKIGDFVRYDMWRRTTTELDTWYKRLGYRIIRTIALVVRGFASKNLNDTAKALTYSLIFAVVPILAMIVAIAKGFGVVDVIETQLNASFLGETGMVPTIMEMVERYLETTQGGVFIGIGILILLWAVYTFFQSVETAFNRIWNVKKSRSILRQATTYIAIVVLIPVLIVCSAGITIFIHSMVGELDGVRFMQFVIVWFMFTMMYLAVPNTRVKIMSALIPGILMGTLFQLLQMLSVYLIALLGRTSIVYGAFATIPILMTWLQYTSLLILIGAEMSYALQNDEEFEYEHDLNRMSRRYKDFVMLYLLTLIVRRFEAAEPAYTSHDLAESNHLPIRLVNALLSRMVETGILTEVLNEETDERTYQPALDTHQMSVGMVMSRIEAQGSEEFLLSPTREMQAFWKQYVAYEQQHNDLNTIMINQL